MHWYNNCKLNVSFFTTSTIIIMTTISSLRFFKTYWLNSLRNQLSKLTRNYYQTMTTGDLKTAGLSRYRSVLAKFFKPLKALNCWIIGYKVQHVLRRAASLVALYGTKNLNLDSTGDYGHQIWYYWSGSTFKSKCGSMIIFICGIVLPDYNWSVNRVYINVANHILKTKFRLFQLVLFIQNSVI